MDKENVVSGMRDGVLLSLKEEAQADICYNVDEPWGRQALWNKPVPERQTVLEFLIDEIRLWVVKVTEPESGTVGATGWWLFQEHRILVLQGKESVEVDEWMAAQQCECV